MFGIGFAICGLLLLLAWKQSESTIRCYWISFLATLPFAFLSGVLQFEIGKPTSVSEALISVLAISFAISLIGATILAALWVFVVRKRAVWECGIGFVMGMAAAPFHLRYLNPPFGFGQPEFSTILILVAVDAVVVGLPLAALFARVGSGNGIVLSAGTVLALCCLGAATVEIPDALFRVRKVPPVLHGLAMAGARHALTGEEPGASYARQYLAALGDVAAIGVLQRDVENGTWNRVAPFPAMIVDQARPNDPTVTIAFRRALARELDQYQLDSTYGEEEQRIVELCELLGKRGDVESVGLLLRAYRIAPLLMNTREAAALALSRIPGDDAALACAGEISKLHPNLDKSLIGLFRKHPDPRVQAAGERKDMEYASWKALRDAQTASIESLVQLKNIAALRARTRTGSTSDRCDAALALVRLGDPERRRAVLDAMPYLSYRGAELRGYADGELARQLCQLSQDDLHLMRFLADWSPPESTQLLARALKQFSLQQAAFGLGRIGGRESARVLIAQWKAGGTALTSMEITMLTAMAMTKDPTTVPILQLVEKRGDIKPALLSDGAPIFAPDIAALGLERIGRRANHTYRGNRANAEKWVEFAQR